uniref:Rho-GAP domain-containing protein n=1 Tax=Panagrolaimus sp. JU765 TaxID=591449 RepID=A0AC34QGS7_9BILA
MSELCSGESVAIFSSVLQIKNDIKNFCVLPDGFADCVQLVDLLDETRQKWKNDVVNLTKEIEQLKKNVEVVTMEKIVLQDKLIQCQAMLLEQECNKTDDDVTVDSIDSHATYTIKNGAPIDHDPESNFEVEEGNDDDLEKTPVAFALSTTSCTATLPQIDIANPETKTDGSPFKSEPNVNIQETPKLPRPPLAKMRRSMSMPLPAPMKEDTVTALRSSSVKTNCSPSRKSKNISYKDVVDNKDHDIHSRRIFTRQKCMTCKEVIKFGYYIRRCKDCKVIWHLQCQLGPCVPFKTVPKSVDGRIRLNDCCTDYKPRLPHPVRRCVLALEKMLDSKLLYSTRYDHQAVKNFLSECIYSKNVDIPNAPEIISNTLLHFLEELREPLILKTSHEEFLVAIESLDNDELYAAIDDLPKINRYTLAYLCLHWKKVVQNASANNLTVERLGMKVMKVLMRIGNSDLLDQHIRVFERLMDIEECVWEKIIEADCYDGPAKGSASTLIRAQSARDSCCIIPE